MFRLNKFFSVIFFVQIATSTLTVLTDQQYRREIIPRVLSDSCLDTDVGKFMKDRYNCHKFIYCGPNGEAVSVDCPYEMIFNDDKGICDFASNYDCVVEKREENLIEIETTVGYPDTTIASTSNFIKGGDQCPMTDSGHPVFLPNPNECHRYYLCYHGSPIPQECIKELHWNQKLGRCDFPENAGCLVATSTVPSTAVTIFDGPIICPPRGEQVFPHPEECNYFIYCINGYATVQQCPFFHHYDFQTRSCKWRTVAKCFEVKK